MTDIVHPPAAAPTNGELPPMPTIVPPVPQLGLPTDKNTLDTQFGGIALRVRQILTEVASSKNRLDGLTDQDLKDRGYTDTQIAQLRSAWNDLNKFVDVFYGRVEGGPAYDYSQFVRFLWGFGV